MDGRAEPPLQSVYSVPWYASFLHEFPRYDLNFHKANATFDHRSQSYVESLVVLALAVIVWLALWLLVFTLYFCYVCLTCRQETEKTIKTRPLRWLTVTLALCTCGAAAWGIYANEKVNKAFWQTEDTLQHIGRMADSGVRETESLCRQLGNVTHSISQIMAELTKSAIGHSSILLRNNTVEGQAHALMRLNATTDAATAIGSAGISDCGEQARGAQPVPPQPWSNVTLTPSLWADVTLQQLEQYSYYRWIVTLASCTWMVVFCLLVWAAVGCKSKWAIFTCVAIAGVTMVVSWTLAAAYTALSVATADICINPKSAFLTVFSVPINDSDVFNYHASCDGRNPATDELVRAHEKLTEFGLLVREVSYLLLQETQDYVDVLAAKDKVTNVAVSLMRLYSSQDCRHYSREFTYATLSLCRDGLSNLAFVLLAFCTIGSLIIAIIFLAYTTARNLRTRKAYSEMEEHDAAFDSRAPPLQGSSPTENPLYYGYSQRPLAGNISSTAAAAATAQSSGEDSGSSVTAAAPRGGPSAPLLLRTSPPPTYNCGEFYSTYSSSHDTLENPRHANNGNAAS